MNPEKQEMAETWGQQGPGLREYLSILSRRIWWLVGTMLVVVGAAGLYTFTSTPIYETRAKLLVESRRSSGVASSDIFASLQGSMHSRNMETLIEVMQSPLVIGPAIESVGIDPTASPGRLPKISIEAVRMTDIVAVSCQSPDALLAARLANAVAEQYLNMTLDQRRSSARHGLRFVDEQLAKAESELAEAEEALSTFSRQVGPHAVDAAITTQLDRRDAQENAVRQLEAEIAARSAELEALRKKLRSEPEFIARTQTLERNPALDSLRAELRKLEVERTGLLEVYAPTHHRVQALDSQMEEIRSQMAGEMDKIVRSEQLENPTEVDIMRRIVSTEADLLAAGERLKVGRTTLEQLNERIEGIPGAQRTVAELRRAISVAEQDYLALKKRQQELRISEAFEMPAASILQEAPVPLAPVKPNKKRNMMLAVYLGLMLGIGMVLLVHYWDDTFASVEEMEGALGLPSLATIQRLGRSSTPDLISLPARSPFAESFRILRSALRFSTVKKSISTLMVTGASVGVGKSTVAMNLAIACAQSGQRTILVDGDLRRPILHRRLDLENNVGVTNCVLEGSSPADVLQDTDCPGLQFMASGPLPPNPAELLESEEMHRLTKDLADMADLVVFDAPPAVGLADAQILARWCDASLIVVELETAKRPLIRRLVDIFRREGIYVPGIVVNRQRQGSSPYYHYYYYQSSDNDGSSQSRKPSTPV